MPRQTNPHRYIRKHRCLTCAMVKEHCICALATPFTCQTRIIIVAHSSEVGKTSNTARLVRMVIPNTEIVVFGGLPNPTDPTQTTIEGENYRCAQSLAPFTAADNAYLLFPDSNAVSLTTSTAHELPRPLTLVVPDGNWSQARKISHRLPVLAALPRIRVPSIGPSLFRVRRAPHSEVLCTLEAVAAALEVLEGPAIKSALISLLEVMVDRTMKLRGEKAPSNQGSQT